MRRIIILSVTITLSVLLASGVAVAITYGQLDNNRHPYVGAFVVSEQDGQKFTACSGTLISPRIFLTAAHCVVDSERFGWRFEGVTFDPTFDPESSPLISGTPHAHPLFERDAAYFHDIAVIELNSGVVTEVGYGELPPARLLDRLNRDGGLKDKNFTSVGYGFQERTHDPGSGYPDYGREEVRMFSTQLFRTLTKSHLKLSQNPALGYGGSCYGDSGGPVFLGGSSSNRLAALTSTGDAVCTATSVNYRLDTPEARAFLDDYVRVP